MSKITYNAVLDIPGYKAWYTANVRSGVFMFDEDAPGKANVIVEGLKHGRAAIRQGCTCVASMPVEYLTFVGGFRPSDF